LPRRPHQQHSAGYWNPGAPAARSAASREAGRHRPTPERRPLHARNRCRLHGRGIFVLRADFDGRGQLADEYIQAIRARFESDRPEYHGQHINFSEALFSPRPKTPIPIVLGGSSKAALRRAANLGDGWYGLRLSPEVAAEAIGAINQIGHKRDFTMSLR